MNIVVPLQIGARDAGVQPVLNSLRSWLYLRGAMSWNAVAWRSANSARTGWLAYPPLSELPTARASASTTTSGALQICLGNGTLLTGVNFFVTIIVKMMLGMTLDAPADLQRGRRCAQSMFDHLRVPDPDGDARDARRSTAISGMHFFTNDGGGKPMMYVNLIWAWGHPDGLHPDPAGLRRILRDHVATFEQQEGCSATRRWCGR